MRIPRTGLVLLTLVLLGHIGAAQHAGDIVDVAIRRWNVGGMVGSIAAAPDGHIWFSLPTAVSIGRLDPKTGTIRTYHLNGGVPSALQVGKDGSVWFVSGEAGWIGRLNERSGKVDRVRIEDTSTATKLAVAPNGDVWFACPRLGLVDARTLAVSYMAEERPILDIAATPQGSVFFIEPDSRAITELDQRLAQVATLALSPPSTRFDRIRSSTSGAALFTDSLRWFVGVHTRQGWEEISMGPHQAGDRLVGVSAGLDGYLWVGVTTGDGLAVSRITSRMLGSTPPDEPSRRQRFMVRQGAVADTTMIAGPGGELWFASEDSSVITRVVGIAAADRR